MSTKLLTIVVPSYNAAEYLPETIPTMAEVKDPAKLEILIINDGSKDNTLQVAQQLKEQYPETVAIIDKENGGHGSTINAGIKAAKGKYFKVVDADDWVITENLSKLMSYLETCDDDQVISPYFKVYMDTHTEVLEEYAVSQAQKTYRYTDFLTEINQLPLMHSITVKTAILRDNGITIDENCFYVDLEYNTFPMPYLHTISYFDEPIYRYRLGRPGQSVSMESYIKNVKMHEKVSFALINFYTKYQDKSDIENKLLTQLIHEIVGIHAKIYLNMPYSKAVKEEYVAYEKQVGQLNPYFLDHHYGKKIGLLRWSRYHLFYLLSKLS